MQETRSEIRTAFKLEEALAYADGLAEILTRYVQEIAVAGSIRRRIAFVHNINLVAIADDRMAVLERLREIQEVFDANMGINEIPIDRAETIWEFKYVGSPVRLHWAKPETYAAVLLLKTGPRIHNLYLMECAKRRKMRLDARYGLVGKSGRTLKTVTEVDIYHKLGLTYRLAEERGFDLQTRQYEAKVQGVQQ